MCVSTNVPLILLLHDLALFLSFFFFFISTCAKEYFCAECIRYNSIQIEFQALQKVFLPLFIINSNDKNNYNLLITKPIATIMVRGLY